MKKMKLDDLNELIEERRKDVNFQLRKKAPSKLPSISNRTPGEKEALTQLAIASWEKAGKAGKIKKLDSRTLYYDYH